MDRVFESGAVAEAPSPPDPALLGYPTETNPPTEPGAWWFYMITEEIRAVLVAAGIAPNPSLTNQLVAAINALIAAAIEAAFPYAITTAATANTVALRDSSADLTAAGFNVSSDVSLKDEIRTLKPGALDRLDLYRGVTYRRKDRPAGSNRMRAGIIAQEFAKARPEGVQAMRRGKEEGAPELLEVDVMATLAELIEALREERDARRKLEAQVAALMEKHG